MLKFGFFRSTSEISSRRQNELRTRTRANHKDGRSAKNLVAPVVFSSGTLRIFFPFFFFVSFFFKRSASRVRNINPLVRLSVSSTAAQISRASERIVFFANAQTARYACVCAVRGCPCECVYTLVFTCPGRVCVRVCERLHCVRARACVCVRCFFFCIRFAVRASRAANSRGAFTA